jgi:hypothetical protein
MQLEKLTTACHREYRPVATLGVGGGGGGGGANDLAFGEDGKDLQRDDKWLESKGRAGIGQSGGQGRRVLWQRNSYEL